jgi:putative transposon-encoded protein
MRKIDVAEGRITMTDEADVIYEKKVTPFRASAKLDVPEKYIDGHAWMILLKDQVNLSQS